MRRDRPQTPDGRYFVARGVLRRCTDPSLPDSKRRALIKVLMKARLAMRRAVAAGEIAAARTRVEQAKVALGEAGPVWWTDGVEDFSGRHPCDTPYQDWWQALPADVRRVAEAD